MGIAAPPTKRSWWRRARFALVRAMRSVIHLTDTPHRIAMGSAAGLVVMPLPLPGQMLLGPLLARMVGGNVVASIPWTWLNNPFTVLFFIYGQYRLGLLFVDGGGQELSFAAVGDLMSRLQEMPWREALAHGVEVLGDVIVPLAVGSAVASALFAVFGYVLVRHLVVVAQGKKKTRYAQWRRSGPSDGRGVDTPT
ncbi:MAG TPA: DUF2062 domain-containing protein [Planctomycetota bacterium]|nr:DUF2062 domain-containing protein [Planctomycetota bacterium]